VAAGQRPSYDPRPPRWLLILVRHGLAILLAIAGVIGIVIGHGRQAAAGAGVVLLGGALMVWMIGWMLRMSISSNKDRDREEEARDYFTRTGHWPGEGGPGEDDA
jgi:hypothetical protein